MAARRRPWQDLTDAERRRWLTAGTSGLLVPGESMHSGQVRAYYEQGGTLHRSRDWSKLSAAQQRRYLAAGRSGRLTGRSMSRRQVRDYYNAGYSMKTGRGHATRERPSYVPAPRGPLQRLNAGKADTADLRDLEDWQRRAAPRYLRNPADFGADTAAALARIHLLPHNWARVQAYHRKDGTIDVYITSKAGRVHKTQFTSEESLRELRDFIEMKHWRSRRPGAGKTARRQAAEDFPTADEVETETP